MCCGAGVGSNVPGEIRLTHREVKRMNILEYIDWLMDQGYTEEEANTMADVEFSLGGK